MANLNSKHLLSEGGGIGEWDPATYDDIFVVTAESSAADIIVQARSWRLAAGSLKNAILVEFATSADGRGFSLAASLRSKGSKHHLLASGALNPDQVSMAFQCGFNAVLVTTEQIEQYGLDAWQRTLEPAVNFSYAPTQSIGLKSIWLQREQQNSL